MLINRAEQSLLLTLVATKRTLEVCSDVNEEGGEYLKNENQGKRENDVTLIIY